MAATQLTPQADTQNSQPKSLRFKIGVALLIVYPFLYLIIPIAPLLPFSGGMQATIAAVVIGVAEVLLLVAIALMGKEGYRAIKAGIKARFSRKGKNADNNGQTDAA